MTKKVEDVLPEGSVSIESVRHLEGFDPFGQIPEIATWRDYAQVDDKPARKSSAKAEKEG